MAFFQQAPVLGDQYAADRALREHLERVLPTDVLTAVEPDVRALGEDAGGRLLALAADAERNPPRLRPYDAWGRRIDEIETSSAWSELVARATQAGLVAVPYEDRYGEYARVVQQALLHLFAPSSAVASCPVAMTDAAARVLSDQATPSLRERVVPRLVARDPSRAWTSGQWMTERSGGSDVGGTETVARNHDGVWRLHGVKWFTSATTADCALALARPEQAGPGSAGLGLFLVELRDPDTGEPRFGRTVLINRLKDKLGTRALPTAELTLAGVPATPVALSGGLRATSGMLNVARAHNAIHAAGVIRRAAALAVSFARVRMAFGRPLIDLPLHRRTVAELQVEAEASLALTVRLAELMGRAEQAMAGDAERAALRALVPVAKLLTGRDAVAAASEAIECFGGAGYVEDTGLPALLRDAQVLPIWEGTTNVLSLDLLRAEARSGAATALIADTIELTSSVDDPGLVDAAQLIRDRADVLQGQIRSWQDLDEEVVQAGMRDFALALGRAYAGALLCTHAMWCVAKRGDDRAVLAARRYARRWLAGQPVRVPTASELEDAARLLAAP